MKKVVFILSYHTLLAKLFSQHDLCENGIYMEETQEKERIGPNYMKLVQGFVYLLAKGGYKNNNNFLDD